MTGLPSAVLLLWQVEQFPAALASWAYFTSAQLLVEVWLVARTSHAISIASRLDVSSVLAIVSLGLMTGGIGITIALAVLGYLGKMIVSAFKG